MYAQGFVYCEGTGSRTSRCTVDINDRNEVGPEVRDMVTDSVVQNAENLEGVEVMIDKSE